jgi:hypothetical protein
MSSWHQAHFVWGIRRCRRAWREAGIPDAFIASPGQLAETARKFLQTYDQSLYMYGTKELDLSRMRDDALFGTTDCLTKHYGPEDVWLLYTWAVRHFLDKTECGRLYMWGTAFERVASTDDPKVSWVFSRNVPLPSVVVQPIRDEYLPETLAHDEQVLTEVEAVSLDDEERQWVSLLRLDPIEATEFDLLCTLEETIRNEHCYRVFTKLSGVLKESDQQLLLAWGNEQAAYFDMLAEWASWPVCLGPNPWQDVSKRDETDS